MKDSNSLRWIIKNGKKQIPKIIILSISNMILALVSTGLALVSKYAIDAAQKAANAKTDLEFTHYRNLIILFGIAILLIISGRLLLRIFAQSLTIKVQASMEMQMRTSLFNKILLYLFSFSICLQYSFCFFIKSSYVCIEAFIPKIAIK